MREIDFLAEIRLVTAAFETAVRTSELAADVPACPGWAVADLVGHLGRIHGWAAEVVSTGAAARAESGHPAWLTSGDAADWYAGTARTLLDAVENCPPEDPCWNFARVSETKGFWLRRQLHETQVHLLDLAQAAGQDLTLDADLSADGVSEVFEVFMPRMAAKGKPLVLRAPVTLVAGDVGTAWRLVPDPAAPIPVLDRSAATQAASGDDRVEGAAADLFTALWRRRGTDRLAVAGDDSRLRAFLGSAFTP